MLTEIDPIGGKVEFDLSLAGIFWQKQFPTPIDRFQIALQAAGGFLERRPADLVP